MPTSRTRFAVLLWIAAMASAALADIPWRTDWQWTWVAGSANTNQLTTYGVQGVPAASNVPGARSSAASCRDDAGGFWLFGGEGYSAVGAGTLSDLWRYDPAAGCWTWIKSFDISDQNGIYGELGLPATSNRPGAREKAVVWPDGTGGLWLFGGFGRSSIGNKASLNDLWRFDIATTNWTWVKGAKIINQPGVYGTRGTPHGLNCPGARYSALSWTGDDGALWLFGGNGWDGASNAGYLNDLWRFDPLTTNWTWIKGSATINQQGIYGVAGTPAPTNAPGARTSAAGCVDADGMFWLFGGYGRAATGADGRMNDLWRFDLATERWTWVKGSSATNQHGIYGVLGESAPANTPGARDIAMMCPDGLGAIWMFGGYGLAEADTNMGRLNDFWRYDPTTTNWTWVKGTAITNHPGTHGTKGSPSENNVIGARTSAIGWTDESGAMWLFGGYGMNDVGAWGRFNDLWRYPQTHSAAFTTDGTPGAALAGPTNQTVIHGGNCDAVTALPPATHHFVHWTWASATYSNANPVTITSVTTNMTFTAVFALSLTTPDAPTGMSASINGNDFNKVVVSWSASARANSYEVWCGTNADSTTATMLADTADTSYDDTSAVPNMMSYYWIKAKNAAGTSAFSVGASGFPGVFGPMIMANGMVGDDITIAYGQALTLTARLYAEPYTGVNVDWWVAAYAQDSGAWYYLNSAMGWTAFDGNTLNCWPIYMGALYDLPMTTLTSGLTLAPGVYNIWFAVDYPMDGVLDLSGQYLLSRVTITAE